ncbi:tyrosine-type recombinase/integrase [Tautonia marina]|uniref:tyrosine-type recombinase/integrase n=1 Tax=Tautonia marina TaxID=2653855 RepID=UPI0012604B35|nr:site-specific integrase [Tautonia marina]
MPRRRPAPFWREQTRCWYVQLGKKQIRLSPDEEEAFRLYHELMSRPAEERADPVAEVPADAASLLDAFLEWTQANRAPHTYTWYQAYLQRFAEALPKGISASELKPFHLTQAMARFPQWGNNTKNDFISAVQRAFNWAVEQELIATSPFARMKKPGREARELAISPAEYAAITGAIGEGAFLDLVELAWETGARVQELRILEAQHVDLGHGRIVLPPSKAKGKKHYRVIYLTDRAKAIVARLMETMPEGPLLLNARGKPWTKDAINCAFTRLSKKLGKKYHLGALRKGFATEALKNGLDTVTVAHLLGHADTSMVSRVYAKVQQDPAFMADAMKRAKG